MPIGGMSFWNFKTKYTKDHHKLNISGERHWLCIHSLYVDSHDDNNTDSSSLPGQNGRHFADGIFKCIFMNENFCILIPISLKFVPKGPIDNKSALV